jgi:hypothetical protein
MRVKRIKRCDGRPDYLRVETTSLSAADTAVQIIGHFGLAAGAPGPPAYRGGRMGAIGAMPVRRGPDQSAGTASTAEATP